LATTGRVKPHLIEDWLYSLFYFTEKCLLVELVFTVIIARCGITLVSVNEKKSADDQVPLAI